MAEAKKTRITGRKERLAIAEFRARHGVDVPPDEELLLLRAIATIPRPGPVFAPPGPLFSEKGAALYDAFLASPGQRLTGELKGTRRIKALAAAARENNVAGFSELLQDFLLSLGIVAPDGVFVPSRGTPGTSVDSSAHIYQTWVDLGRCKPKDLAIAIKGRKTYNSTPDKKTLRETLMGKATRYEARLPELRNKRLIPSL